MSYMRSFRNVSRISINAFSPLKARSWFVEASYGLPETKFSSESLNIDGGFRESVKFSPVVDLQLKTMVGQALGIDQYTDRRYCLKIQESTHANSYIGEYGYEFRQSKVSHDATHCIATDLTAEEVSELMQRYEADGNLIGLLRNVRLLGGQVNQEAIDALKQNITESGLMPLNVKGFGDYNKVILGFEPDLAEKMRAGSIPSSTNQGARPS